MWPPFPFRTWVYVPPASAGPCMSSNYTYTPFHVAATRRRPFWAHTWNKAIGRRPGGLTLAGPPCPAGLGVLPGPEHHMCGALRPESPSSPTPTIPQGPGTCHLLCRAPHHARPAAHHCPLRAPLSGHHLAASLFPQRGCEGRGDPHANHRTCSCSVTVAEGRIGARAGFLRCPPSAGCPPESGTCLLPVPLPLPYSPHLFSPFPKKIILLLCKRPRDLFWTRYILTYNSVWSQSIRNIVC